MNTKKVSLSTVTSSKVTVLDDLSAATAATIDELRRAFETPETRIREQRIKLTLVPKRNPKD